MKIDISVPEAGESITQVELARWLVEDGVYVEKDQEIAEIDSDKATLTINAGAAGVIKIAVEEGTTLEPGKVIGQIDTQANPPEPGKGIGQTSTQAAPPASADTGQGEKQSPEQDMQSGDVTFSPQAKKMMEDLGISPGLDAIRPDSKRITKKDILAAISSRVTGADHSPQTGPPTVTARPWGSTRKEDRQKMSTLRKKVAERLVAVKNQTAMLTTFNEADM